MTKYTIYRMTTKDELPVSEELMTVDTRLEALEKKAFYSELYRGEHIYVVVD